MKHISINSLAPRCVSSQYLFEATTTPIYWYYHQHSFLLQCSRRVQIDEPSNKAVAVDPFDVEKVSAVVMKEGVQIVGGLTTHHHFDHSGGNKVDSLSLASLTLLSYLI
jgi:glyoxylase-like metal-dependent hydrolase (beta-lactamase superfamily II)